MKSSFVRLHFILATVLATAISLSATASIASIAKTAAVKPAVKTSAKSAVKPAPAAASTSAPTATATAKPTDESAVNFAPSVATLPTAEENLFQKYVHDMYSPFVNPTALKIFAAGTFSTVALVATHRDFEDKLLEDTANGQPLGRLSVVGDYGGQLVPNVAYIAYHSVAYLITKDPTNRYRAEIMLRSSLAATSMSTLLKLTVREPRPGNDSELTSFPSGHATSAFAFATTIAALHGVYWGAGAYTLATFVAISRMNDNRHRLHDVVAGAAIGSMYGLAVYERMRDAAAPSLKSAEKPHYDIMPVVTNDAAVLNFTANF